MMNANTVPRPCADGDDESGEFVPDYLNSLTPRAAAEYLGVSLKTLRRWHYEYRLRGRKIGGRLAFAKADLDQAKANGHHG